MSSSGDRRQSRHKRRHGRSSGATTFAAVDFVELKVGGKTLDEAIEQALKGWGRRLDSDDPECKARLAELQKSWRDWPQEDRWVFMEVVQLVTIAERAKRPPRREAIADRYRRFRKLGISALVLADGLIKQFPPPWTGDSAAIGEVVRPLVNFSIGCFNATGFPAKFPPSARARAWMDSFFGRTQHGQGSMELLTRMVALATGTGVTSRTLRRYQDKGSPKSPGHREWNKYEPLIENVLPHRDAVSVPKFIEATMAFLRVEIDAETPKRYL